MRHTQKLVERQVAQAVRLGLLPRNSDVRTSTWEKNGRRYFLDIASLVTPGTTVEKFIGVGPRAASKTVYEMTGVKPSVFL